MVNSFPLPNESNVSLEDMIILPITITNKTTLCKAFPITGKGTTYVEAKDDLGEVHEVNYDASVILKKDGTFLIGRQAYDG